MTTINMVTLGEIIMNHLRKKFQTVVVCEAIKYMAKCGQFFSLEFFITQSFSSSLAVSRSGHASTVVYTDSHDFSW